MTTKKQRPTPKAVWAYYAADLEQTGTAVALEDDYDRDELRTLVAEGRIRILEDGEEAPDKVGPGLPGSPTPVVPVVTNVPAEQRKAQAKTPEAK